MATIGPTLDSTGISVPDYSNILTQLKNAYLSIYGTDSDLDPDTQDGQFLSIFAQAISDCDNAAQGVYNAFQLNTAQGSGLSSLVKLVGVRRAPAGFSTDTVTIIGTFGITITAGQVGDSLNQGSIWALPPLVNIPESGQINVTIINTVAGAVTYAPGEINTILTPTYGWASVVNIGPATAGAPVQTDAQLRVVATNAVGGPASTILESIYSAIDNAANVTRFTVYENDTDFADANGQGPHSIYAVVQGGATQDIVNAIGQTKSPGTTTLGTSSGTFIDQNGVPDVIHYYPLTLVTITVIITLVPFAGYTAAVEAYIQQAVAYYLSNTSIGEDSYLSRLYGPATLNGDAATIATGQVQTALDVIAQTFDIVSIEQSRASDAPPAAQNVPLVFNEASVCTVLNITVNTTDGGAKFKAGPRLLPPPRRTR
jgi:uncharacterized phage protein gp47/JayE